MTLIECRYAGSQGFPQSTSVKLKEILLILLKTFAIRLIHLLRLSSCLLDKLCSNSTTGFSPGVEKKFHPPLPGE